MVTALIIKCSMEYVCTLGRCTSTFGSYGLFVCNDA